MPELQDAISVEADARSGGGEPKEWEKGREAQGEMVPKVIQGIAGLRVCAVPKLDTGSIYFLVDGDEVVYVGQANCLMVRINKHQTENAKKFDRVFFYEIPRAMLDADEAAWIKQLCPKYNLTGNWKRVVSPKPNGARVKTVDPEPTELIEVVGSKILDWAKGRTSSLANKSRKLTIGDVTIRYHQYGRQWVKSVGRRWNAEHTKLVQADFYLGSDANRAVAEASSLIERWREIVAACPSGSTPCWP